MSIIILYVPLRKQQSTVICARTFSPSYACLPFLPTEKIPLFYRIIFSTRFQHVTPSEYRLSHVMARSEVNHTTSQTTGQQIRLFTMHVLTLAGDITRKFIRFLASSTREFTTRNTVQSNDRQERSSTHAPKLPRRFLFYVEQRVLMEPWSGQGQWQSRTRVSGKYIHRSCFKLIG